MGSEVSTKNLKRVLGRKELLSGAIGTIVGGGIFSLTGIGIGLTGRSIVFSFIIAAIIGVLGSVPTIFASGTVRMRGGNYTHMGLLGKERFAGMFVIIHIATNLTGALYAISFAEYFLALVPSLNIKVIALIFLTVIGALNIFGIKNAARVQNFMVLAMVLALTLFTAVGFVKVEPGYFSGEGFMPMGIMGVIIAGAYLSFAISGAAFMVNFSAEAKNPVKDIPWVIIVSTLVVGIFYAAMGVVASGVLPVDQVANKPLNLVAAEILPAPVYIFFMVGGALFALATTLNSGWGWMTKPLIQACADGWLPKKLGSVNARFKTPHWLIMILWAIAVLPVLIGWDLTQISNMTIILFRMNGLLLAAVTLKLPKVLPAEWKNSKYHVSQGALRAWILAAIFVNLLSIVLLASLRSTLEIGINLAIFVGAYLFGLIGEKRGKVNMEISYEQM